MGLLGPEEALIFSRSLTTEGLKILRLRAKGQTRQEVAESLSISERQVRSSIQRVFRFLGAQDTTQAVLRAINSGWINLDELIGECDPEKLKFLFWREMAILGDLSNPTHSPGNKAIAYRLTLSSGEKISEDTVKSDLKFIYKKLGVQNRTQAALFYLVARK